MKNTTLLLLVFIVFESGYSNDYVLKSNKEYECIAETRVSGLFQFSRKFLKETDFFPGKTTLMFEKDYSLLVEKESIMGKKLEARYKFNCKEEKKKNLIICRPIDDNNTYSITLSLDTLRYKKTLITNYWLFGKGNEVDYVHIAHGYCYDID